MKRYEGPVSDHFNGEVFFNEVKPEPRGRFSFFKWIFFGERKKWPQWVENQHEGKPAEKVDINNIAITFVNHAGFLIQLDDLNILTDPVWSERTSPVGWLGPKRVRKPGIEYSKLPKIDFVLVSHNHYDHLDLPTLGMLEISFNPKILCGLGDKKVISPVTNVHEMDWWQSIKVNDHTEIFYVPAQHWSSRTGFDRNKSLWGAFVIRHRNRLIYFAGDTGYGPHFKKTFEKFGAFDVALLPIGAYEPRWFMKYQHMNPEEAVLAHLDLKSKKSIGMHFGTWQLTDEAIDDPPKDLAISLNKNAIDQNDFIVPEVGATYWYK